MIHVGKAEIEEATLSDLAKRALLRSVCNKNAIMCLILVYKFFHTSQNLSTYNSFCFDFITLSNFFKSDAEL